MDPYSADDIKRRKRNFSYKEDLLEKTLSLEALIERMMSVILRIPDLVDQSLATVNQKLVDLESRINNLRKEAIGLKTKNDNKDSKADDTGHFPYPYIFKPPEPPDDIGVATNVQCKRSVDEEEPEVELFCRYCGSKLAMDEHFCSVCGEKF